MAYVAQTNPDDDLTEQTGQLQGNNATPTLASGGSFDADPNAATTSTASTTNTVAPNANATQGTGFSNIQRYLSANNQGGVNLGNQVANSLDTTTNVAQQKMNDVNTFATNNPNSNIWNTTQDADAQQAITQANQKAALTGNVAGQTQLIRSVAPTTTQGGLNLDQFLMQNSAGDNIVKGAAQRVAPLQSTYAGQSNSLQENATLRQALAKLQASAAANATGLGNYTATSPGGTSQVPVGNTVPNSNSVLGSTTTANPYAGLSAEQIAYLNRLRAGTAGAGATGGVNQTTGQIVRTPITATISPGGTGGRGSQGDINVNTTSSSWGNGMGASNAAGPDAVGTGMGGFSLSPTGVVTPNTTGLSNTMASAIGTLAGAITHIPGLGLLGSYLNNRTNVAAANAANSFSTAIADSNPNTNGTVGDNTVPTATAGSNGTGGTAADNAAAAAGAAVAAGLSDAAAGAAAQAAANATLGGASAAAAAAAGAAAAAAADQASQDAANAASQAANDAAVNAANAQAAQDAANAQAASDYADAQQAASDYANAVAADQAAQQASQDAANAQAAADAGAAAQAASDAQAAADAATTSTDTDTGTDSDSDSGDSDGGDSDSGGGESSGDKDGGYIRGPGTSRSDSIPRMLSNGEYVINAKVVAALGKEFFDKLNNSVK